MCAYFSSYICNAGQFVKFLFIVLFIASFAFVLQRLRAKPIPLRLHYPKAPSGRELPTKSGEGERVTIKSI